MRLASSRRERAILVRWQKLRNQKSLTIQSCRTKKGWEVKSLRAKKSQLTDTYVLIQDGEAFLLGCHVTPLESASSHVVTDPTRTKKLLLHKKELSRLFSATQQKGYACVCTKLYWKSHLVKAQIALAKGKQAHDKRATVKERQWNIDKQRLVRHNNR